MKKIYKNIFISDKEQYTSIKERKNGNIYVIIGQADVNYIDTVINEVIKDYPEFKTNRK
ncbi:MAG: hypothetical protein RR489_06825 [Clostridia bacterium]